MKSLLGTTIFLSDTVEMCQRLCSHSRVFCPVLYERDVVIKLNYPLCSTTNCSVGQSVPKSIGQLFFFLSFVCQPQGTLHNSSMLLPYQLTTAEPNRGRRWQLMAELAMIKSVIQMARSICLWSAFRLGKCWDSFVFLNPLLWGKENKQFHCITEQRPYFYEWSEWKHSELVVTHQDLADLAQQAVCPSSSHTDHLSRALRLYTDEQGILWRHTVADALWLTFSIFRWFAKARGDVWLSIGKKIPHIVWKRSVTWLSLGTKPTD